MDNVGMSLIKTWQWGNHWFYISSILVKDKEYLYVVIARIFLKINEENTEARSVLWNSSHLISTKTKSSKQSQNMDIVDLVKLKTCKRIT